MERTEPAVPWCFDFDPYPFHSLFASESWPVIGESLCHARANQEQIKSKTQTALQQSDFLNWDPTDPTDPNYLIRFLECLAVSCRASLICRKHAVSGLDAKRMRLYSLALHELQRLNAWQMPPKLIMQFN